ncbi:MAG: thymidylate synthase [Bilifractor sp.]
MSELMKNFDMAEEVVYGRNLPEAYHKALLALEEDGQVTDCRDWNCRQKEVSMTMCVAEPLSEPMISKCFIGGPKELEQYRQEMLYGILDFEVEKGNWAYTYHQRYADQIPFIVEELKRNPSSRRAVMTVRDKEADMGSDDPACLQHIQYFIRENRLCCKVLFRSNDACKAAFMNAFALIMLQKSIADELDIGVGSYTHRANSFHCYDKDFDLLDGYVKRIRKSVEEDDPDEVCFDYVDGWDEMMEDAKPAIAAQVEELRKN